MFVRNEGNVDRLVRALIGTVLVLLSFMMLVGVMKWVAFVVGMVLLATGALGVCPIYKMMGMNTNTAQGEGASKS